MANVQIRISTHAFDRYKARLFIEGRSEFIQREMIDKVKRSRLSRLKPDGEEHRINGGVIFVIKREKKYGQMETLTVVTIKLTSELRRQNFSDEQGNIDYEALANAI